MSDKVFLSYAEEDALVARRIHNALTRSEVTVWGYKEDGRVGVNFEEELTKKIRAARFFCLLDSAHSRSSDWIRRECQLSRRSEAIMVVCSVEVDIPEDRWRSRELFEGHNQIRGIDFTNFDVGIHQLCKHLRVVYSSGSTLPRDQDLEAEVFRSNLTVDRAQQLLDLYRNFREQYADTEFAEAQLRVVIKKCMLYGAREVISPSLALGVMLGELGRHRKAHNVFLRLTESHPRDPRTWAGLGGALYHLGLYEDSLRALERSKAAILSFYKDESVAQLAGVVHNIASTLLVLGRRKDAQTALDSLSSEERENPFIFGIQGRLLLAGGNPAAALQYLERAYFDSLERFDYSTSLIISLADCYLQLQRTNEEIGLMEKAMGVLSSHPEICRRAADCFRRHGRIRSALAALEKAAEGLPESPTYRAQLASALYQVGRTEEAITQARACLGSQLSPHDRYYRGLAFYLVGRFDIAEFELTECRKIEVLSQWPHYSEVLGPKTPTARRSE